jgi:serine protease Do
MNPRLRWFAAGVGAAALVVALLHSPLAPTATVVHASPQGQSVPNARSSAAGQEVAVARGLSAAFEHVAEIIKPSVVSISSAKRVQASSAPLRNSPFHDFFGDDLFNRFFNAPQGGDQVEQGLGTGVIVSTDGKILTNNHVVAGADEVSVRLDDGRNFKAKVLGTDPKTDLAVLQIAAKDLQPAQLGNSADLKIGEWVIAAGNPFGLTSSISAGIVSAKGRSNLQIADYEDFIQTDAAINPGNSGGPLVNLEGEVVGINTAIFSRSGGYMGIGFSIPIDMAQSVMGSLIKEGRVVRGFLGVQIQDLNEDLARSFGYDGKDGVLVGDVVENSPAAKAGIQSEDIIVGFEGKHPKNSLELRSLVSETKPGTRVTLQVFRKGRTQDIRVQVSEQDTKEVAEATPENSKTSDLGVSVRTLTPELARQAGYEAEVGGVLVTDVDPLGPAGRAGVRDGDLIVSVQGKEVHNSAEFSKAVRAHNLKEGIRLTLQNDRGRRFVFVKTESEAG